MNDDKSNKNVCLDCKYLELKYACIAHRLRLIDFERCYNFKLSLKNDGNSTNKIGCKLWKPTEFKIETRIIELKEQLKSIIEKLESIQSIIESKSKK